ncbi:MAG TPA: prephenate dehydrogenase/arogenate dehydrogenase family protein [Spirochaetota bacterium]|nr:prephenate dehydrogenase/arogenate dehydrogenase family protein [Spirochaetota bacterium]HPJ34634.1 prephenate dehydrogenase/arogenate dehydrogenase family protein [Spirochaetota bacterium]
MKIVIIGAGKMGTWLTEELCFDHDVAVYDSDPKHLKHFINIKRFMELEEITGFKPELLINCVNLQKTEEVFEQVLPLIPKKCIIADIASVKNGLADFYKKSGRKFVSTHPMFGPTFGNVRDLSSENAVIISESDPAGKKFFHELFEKVKLNIYEYSFEEHDRITAYSLSTPFSSSLVFAACMKKIDAPGTTFKKHMEIARGVLSEDDYLLSEILFNPYTLKQIESINQQLSYLTHIIRDRDYDEMVKFLGKLRGNIK